MLVGDRVFWISSALLLATVLPYALRVLSPVSMEAWRFRYADTVYALAMTVTASVGVGRLASASERRVWRLVAAAYGVMVMIEVLTLFVPLAEQALVESLAVESLYLFFFLMLFLAAEASRGRARHEGLWKLDSMRYAGFGLVAFGLILYFDGVPSASLPADSYTTWAANLFLFAILDGAVCGWSS